MASLFWILIIRSCEHGEQTTTVLLAAPEQPLPKSGRNDEYFPPHLIRKMPREQMKRYNRNIP
jgi:hypothetical protein